MTKKVIKFPEKYNDGTFPTNPKESLEYVEAVRREFCDHVSDDVFEAVISIMNNYGLSVKSTETFLKDAVFLEETIKALLYRIKRISHPLHEIIDQSVTIPDDIQQEINSKSDDGGKPH